MPDLQPDHEILAQVIAIVAGALRIKPNTITPQSRLFRDLNAESLDIVDIRFQIERQFGFKIDQGEIYQSVGHELTAEEVQEQLTVASIAGFVAHRLEGLKRTP